MAYFGLVFDPFSMRSHTGSLDGRPRGKMHFPVEMVLVDSNTKYYHRFFNFTDSDSASLGPAIVDGKKGGTGWTVHLRILV